MKSQRGFTLVELLLYSSILAVVGGMLTGVLFTSIRTQNRDAASNEVTQQLDFVMSTVQRLVRDSSLIDIAYEGTATGTPCSQYCTLRLRMPDSSDESVEAYKNLTIIRSDANGVYLQEGSAEEVPLTTDEITVDNLVFTKTEVAGGHATIQVDATFSRNTQNPQLAVTKSLQSAISRVSAATFDSDLIPNAVNSFDLGQSSPNPTWKNLFLSNDLAVGNALTVSGDGTIDNNLTIGSDLIVSGNAGFGTTNPGSEVHVKAKPGFGGNADLELESLTNAYKWTVASMDEGHFAIYDKTNNKTPFKIATNTPNELLFLDSTGGVGIGTTLPNGSAILDLFSISKGFLPPRLTTTQRDAISSPAAGLVIYNTTDDQHNAYDGTAWGSLAGVGTTYVPLITPLTSPNYDYSVISGDRTIDLQTEFGVPANARAVNVTVRFRDATAGTLVNVAPINTGNDVGTIFQGAEESNRWTGGSGVVPTNVNGDIVLDVNGTIDSLKLVIWGYWL